MKKLINNALIISMFMIALLFAGCSEDDEDGNLPQLTSGFTLTTNEDTGTVTFINISEKADNYLWDFGDETTSTEINPIKTYPTGTYTVSLTATNVAGATDISSDTLTIFIKDIISIPATFDDEANIRYEATAFEGASFEIVDNPDVSGANEKATNVGAITNSGAEYEGIYFDLGVDVDLAEQQSILINFWSDAAIDVLMKLELGSGEDAEAIGSHTGAGWESVRFDFESMESFSRLTLFVDGPGTTEGTFYIDDITQIVTPDTTPPVITLLGDDPITLVVGDTYTDAGATAEDIVDGDISANIVVGGDAVNTDIEGTYVITYNVNDAAGNAATEVTRTVNVIAADTEAPVITLIGNNPLNLTVDNTYSEPGASATDNLDGDISASIIIDASAVNTAIAGTYNVTYNVSDAAGNPAIQVVREVIVAAASSDGNLLTNGDFETGDDTGWLLFANGGTTEIDNTNDNGGAFSGKIATNGASNPGFKQERFGIGTVQAGDVVQVSFDHIGSATAPEGGVFNVLLFVERAEGEVGDPITHIFDPRPTLTAEWSPFTATFTIPGDASVTGGLSILIETVCGGTPGCSVSANIDNVSVVLNP